MNTSPRQGFSLIELSIVMVIIGILLSAGLSILGPSIKEATASKNEKFLQDDVDGLKGYAATNRIIPAGLSGYVRHPRDAHNNSFAYIVAANLDASDDICPQRTTPLRVVSQNTGLTISDVAFVLVSRGHDGAQDYTSATAAGITTITIPTYNASANVDDQAEWMTLGELQGISGCGNRQIQIVNTTLPSTTENSTYPTIDMVAINGSGSYEWCVRDITISSIAGITITPTPDTNTCGSAGNPYSSTTASITGGTVTTPSATGGTFHAEFSVRDASNTSSTFSKTFSITVNPPQPLQIITTSLPSTQENSSYPGVRIYAENGSGGYQWCIEDTSSNWSVISSEVASSPVAPAHNDCNESSEFSSATYAALEGSSALSCSSAGAYTFTYHVMDSNGNVAQKTLSFTVDNICS